MTVIFYFIVTWEVIFYLYAIVKLSLAVSVSTCFWFSHPLHGVLLMSTVGSDLSILYIPDVPVYLPGGPGVPGLQHPPLGFIVFVFDQLFSAVRYCVAASSVIVMLLLE